MVYIDFCSILCPFFFPVFPDTRTKAPRMVLTNVPVSDSPLPADKNSLCITVADRHDPGMRTNVPVSDSPLPGDKDSSCITVSDRHDPGMRTNVPVKSLGKRYNTRSTSYVPTFSKKLCRGNSLY